MASSRKSRNTGIIPARAGSTRIFMSASGTDEDHPRSCGEHRVPWATCRRRSGSSPLVRGALDGRGLAASSWRIIPARAGSTRRWDHAVSRRRDHPRSCGEHMCLCVGVEELLGSSPLVRGALGRREAHVGGLGIIPARAGSTMCAATWLVGTEDHPRSCGEHRGASRQMVAQEGSSPLVRGALPCP